MSQMKWTSLFGVLIAVAAIGGIFLSVSHQVVNAAGGGNACSTLAAKLLSGKVDFCGAGGSAGSASQGLSKAYEKAGCGDPSELCGPAFEGGCIAYVNRTGHQLLGPCGSSSDSYCPATYPGSNCAIDVALDKELCCIR